MIDIELDILLRKKLGVRRNKYKYIIPRRCGKTIYLLRQMLRKFLQRDMNKKMNDWITIQSIEDYPEEYKLAVFYVGKSSRYYIGQRVASCLYPNFVKDGNNGILKMEHVKAWRYFEPYHE